MKVIRCYAILMVKVPPSISALKGYLADHNCPTQPQSSSFLASSKLLLASYWLMTIKYCQAVPSSLIIKKNLETQRLKDLHKGSLLRKKLDGVGPADSKPSTD